MSLRTAVADPRPSWHHPRILSLLLTVFLCGAAAGALTMRMTSSANPRPSISSWKQGTREMSLAWFREELALTPEQAREIETVLDDYVMFYQNLQEQMDDFRALGHSRILRILTPEQRAKFEKSMSQFSEKLR